MTIQLLGQADRWQVALGDAVEVLRLLPAASIDSLVTDPPAGIEFMGKEFDTFKFEWTDFADVPAEWMVDAETVDT